MANRKGMVINTNNDGWAEVMVQDDDGCSSCQSGCGCSIGTQGPKVATRVLNKVGAKKGDLVAIRMDTSKVLISIALLYLVPIAGLMAGAILGADIDALGGNGEAIMAVVLGGSGLGLGFLLSILLSRKMSSNTKFSPVITRIIRINEIRANYAKKGSWTNKSKICSDC